MSLDPAIESDVRKMLAALEEDKIVLPYQVSFRLGRSVVHFTRYEDDTTDLSIERLGLALANRIVEIVRESSS